jgi:hypothetical protein
MRVCGSSGAYRNPNISGVMSKRTDVPASEGAAPTWPLAHAGKWGEDCLTRCSLTASKSRVQKSPVQASCPISGGETSGTVASVATCSGNTIVSTSGSSGCVICHMTPPLLPLWPTNVVISGPSLNHHLPAKRPVTPGSPHPLLGARASRLRPTPPLLLPYLVRARLRRASTSASSSAADMPESVSRYSPCVVRLGLG